MDLPAAPQPLPPSPDAFPFLPGRANGAKSVRQGRGDRGLSFAKGWGIGIALALVTAASPAPLLAADTPPVAAAPVTRASADPSRLAAHLDALLDSPPLDRGFAGAMVVSARTGDVLYRRNENRRFMPASNVKLFTTAAALEYLDPERRFETRVLLRGKPGERNGEWKGDLILRGGGDPSLTVEALEDLAREFAAAGIRRIQGDIVTDATLFTGPGRGPDWGWNWESDYYAAPASALTVNRGRVTVTVTPALKVGRPPRVTFTPAASGLKAEIRARTTEAATGEGTTGEDTLNVTRRHASEIVEVSGMVPLNGKPVETELAVDDPENLAGRVFNAALKRYGMTLSGTLRPISPSEAAVEESKDRRIAHRTSPPLRVLLREMNLPSDNVYAETLLRHVGLAAPAPIKGGGTEAVETAGRGIAAERAFLDRLGIAREEANLVDGSGVSRKNLVTPLALIRLLQGMRAHRHGAIFYESLPVAGRTGTLRRRMIGTPAEANVRAKTGTLTAATALSGIVHTRTGEPLLFAIVMNHYAGESGPARAIQDRFCATLADLLDSLPPVSSSNTGFDNASPRVTIK